MKSRRSMLILVSASLLVAGCPKEEKGDDPAAPRPRLVSDAELKAFELDIGKIKESSRTRKCPRPVLRGNPLPGRAADEIRTIVAGTGVAEACMAKLEEKSEMLHEAITYPEGHVPEGFPARLNRTAKPQADAPKDLEELEKTCQPVIELIQKSARREDGCSPFLPGLHEQPAFIGVIRASRVAAATARRQTAGDNPEKGLALLLDTVRFGQDFSRGGTSLLETMIGVACARTVLPVVEAGLNRSEPLDTGLLQQVERELGVLIRGQSHPAEYLRGEMESMATLTLNPEVQAKDTEGQEGPFTTKTFGIDEKEDNALALIAIREMWMEMLAGCKPEAPPVACADHLRTVAKRLSEAKTGDMARVQTLLNVTFSKDKVAAIRREVIDILKAVAAPAFDKYLAKEGEVRFRLAALRLHAAYRRLAEEKKTCPGAGAFEQPPLAGLRTDPYSGKAIRVESIAPGRFALRSPVQLGEEGGEPAEPAVFIDCPYR